MRFIDTCDLRMETTRGTESRRTLDGASRSWASYEPNVQADGSSTFVRKSIVFSQSFVQVFFYRVFLDVFLTYCQDCPEKCFKFFYFLVLPLLPSSTSCDHFLHFKASEVFRQRLECSLLNCCRRSARQPVSASNKLNSGLFSVIMPSDLGAQFDWVAGVRQV